MSHDHDDDPQWFAELFGQEFGPVSAGKLREMAADRTIDAGTPLRHGTEGGWRPAGEWDRFTFPDAVPIPPAPAATPPPPPGAADEADRPAPPRRVGTGVTGTRGWTGRETALVAGAVAAAAASVSFLAYGLLVPPGSAPPRLAQASGPAANPAAPFAPRTGADGAEDADTPRGADDGRPAVGFGDAATPAGFGTGRSFAAADDPADAPADAPAGPVGSAAPPVVASPAVTPPAPRAGAVAARADRNTAAEPVPVPDAAVAASSTTNPAVTAPPVATPPGAAPRTSGPPATAAPVTAAADPPAGGAGMSPADAAGGVVELNNAALAEVDRRHLDEAIDLWERAAAVPPHAAGPGHDVSAHGVLAHNVGRAAALAENAVLPASDGEKRDLAALFEALSEGVDGPAHRPRVGWLHMASAGGEGFEDRVCPVCSIFDLKAGLVPCTQPDCNDGQVRVRETYVAHVTARGDPVYATRPARQPCTTCGGDDIVTCQHCDGTGTDPGLEEPVPQPILARHDNAHEAFEFAVLKTPEFRPLLPRKIAYEGIVFVEPEGERFHAQNCRYGGGFETSRIATVRQAVEMGRTPCLICGGTPGLERTIPGVDWSKPERGAAGTWVVDGTHPDGNARMTVFLNDRGKWRLRLVSLGRRRLYLSTGRD